LDPRTAISDSEAAAVVGPWWGQVRTAVECFKVFGRGSALHTATGGFVEKVGPEALDRFVASGKARMCRGVTSASAEAVSGTEVDTTAASGTSSLAGVFAVYTAMHGVGSPGILRAMRAWGHATGGVGLETTYGGPGWEDASHGGVDGDASPLTGISLVKAQCEPDPMFPTVEYPNPEEGKGALLMSFQEAGRIHE